MKIDIPEYLIEMVLDWKDREKEHNSLGQIGQADDCYSFNNYQKTVLNDLFEIFKNIDVIQKQPTPYPLSPIPSNLLHQFLHQFYKFVYRRFVAFPDVFRNTAADVAGEEFLIEADQCVGYR